MLTLGWWRSCSCAWSVCKSSGLVSLEKFLSGSREISGELNMKSFGLWVLFGFQVLVAMCFVTHFEPCATSWNVKRYPIRWRSRHISRVHKIGTQWIKLHSARDSWISLSAISSFLQIICRFIIIQFLNIDRFGGWTQKRSASNIFAFSICYNFMPMKRFSFHRSQSTPTLKICIQHITWDCDETNKNANKNYRARAANRKLIWLAGNKKSFGM